MNQENNKSFFPIWTVVFILINFVLYLIYPFDKVKFNDVKINQCLINKKISYCEQLSLKESRELFLEKNYFEGYQIKESVNLFCFIDNFPECFPKGFIQVFKLSLRASRVVSNGEWYRLFTSVFMHSSWYHLSNNMIFLLIFGFIVERHLKNRFVPFYFLNVLLTNLLIILSNPDALKFEMGASGAIFALMAAALVLYKRTGKINSNLGSQKIISIPTHRILFLFFINIFLFVLFGSISKTSYLAHLLGFISGFLLIFPFKTGLSTPNGNKF